MDNVMDLDIFIDDNIRSFLNRLRVHLTDVFVWSDPDVGNHLKLLEKLVALPENYITNICYDTSGCNFGFIIDDLLYLISFTVFQCVDINKVESEVIDLYTFLDTYPGFIDSIFDEYFERP